MIRRLFTIFSAFSLLLCLAATALWVRSYWHTDAIGIQRWHQYVLGSGEGWVTVSRVLAAAHRCIRDAHRGLLRTLELGPIDRVWVGLR